MRPEQPDQKLGPALGSMTQTMYLGTQLSTFVRSKTDNYLSAHFPDLKMHSAA
jgi:hypothetical protein